MPKEYMEKRCRKDAKMMLKWHPKSYEQLEMKWKRHDDEKEKKTQASLILGTCVFLYRPTAPHVHERSEPES